MCMLLVSPDRGLAVHVAVERCLAVPGTGIGVGILGGYTGWVIPGTCHPPTARALRYPPPDSDRRERALACRARVVRMQVGTDPFA